MPKKKSTSSKPVSRSKLDTVKDWFKRSETIFLARLAAFSGLITTFVGSLDFSPLWSMFTLGTDFTQKQLIFMGIGILGAGVAIEVARRRNATDL